MNNRVNYTLVGTLVFVGVIFVAGFSYWMLKPSVKSEAKIYSIDFDESVLGLNLDAPVKYRGITVGKVVSIGINDKDVQQVRVLVSILKSTPIKEDTVAKLTAQGITGLSYINLSMGSNAAAFLRAKDREKYPLIKSVPSFFTNFEQSFSSVSTRLSSTLGRTEQLLGEKNQKELTLLLEKTASVMEKMDRLLNDKTIKHLQNSAKNLDSFSEKLDQTIPRIDAFIEKSEEWENKISHSFNSIMRSYLGIKASMNEIKRAVSSGEFNIKAITADVVPTMNATFLEMQELMVEFEDVLQEYKKSPSDILYKKIERKKAPGEN